MAAEIVNLNQFRKHKERVDKGRQADANRSIFGRTKGEKLRDRKETERAENRLSDHEFDDEPEPA